MTKAEIKGTLSLGFVFACRMLGLFMILPVIMLYVDRIPGATPAMLGLAAGIYGLTQAILQIPFGLMSDYWGRKPVIFLGLILFALGSLIAASSESITGLILGRAIQGMGAIGSVVLAFLADITREEVRTRAMALVGMSIGATFVLAFLLGPIIDGRFGLSALFLLSAFLAVLAMIMVMRIPAKPNTAPMHLFSHLGLVLKDKALWQTNTLIFVVHAILTAYFLILPGKILEIADLTSAQAWRFYLPILFISVLLVTPFLRSQDLRVSPKKAIQWALLLWAICIALLLKSENYSLFFMLSILFFAAFNFLEAALPAWISRLASPESRGTALGIYAFAQFLGMFAGGAIGGILLQWHGRWAVATTCVVLTLVGWLVLAINIRAKVWQEVSTKSF